MKPRTTLILALILVVLVGVAALFESNKRKSRAPTGKPLFSTYSMEKADGIAVRGSGTDVDLRKQGDRWVVASEGWHEADPKLPKQILESIADFTSASLISNAPEKHATFQVDSTGTSVRVSSGSKVVADFVAGKPGPDYMSTYVRPAGDQRVYLVPSNLSSMLNRGGESWRKTLLVDVDQSVITGYTTRNAKETVTVERAEDGTWKIKDPTPGDARPDIVSIVLRSLAQVRSTSFADTTLSPTQVGLEPDSASVVIRTADGSSYTLLIGATNEKSQSYTKLADSPTIYLVPRGRWNTVFRPLNTLIAPAVTPEAAAPAGS